MASKKYKIILITQAYMLCSNKYRTIRHLPTFMFADIYYPSFFLIEGSWISDKKPNTKIQTTQVMCFLKNGFCSETTVWLSENGRIYLEPFLWYIEKSDRDQIFLKGEPEACETRSGEPVVEYLLGGENILSSN